MAFGLNNSDYKNRIKCWIKDLMTFISHLLVQIDLRKAASLKMTKHGWSDVNFSLKHWRGGNMQAQWRKLDHDQGELCVVSITYSQKRQSHSQ